MHIQDQTIRIWYHMIQTHMRHKNKYGELRKNGGNETTVGDMIGATFRIVQRRLLAQLAPFRLDICEFGSALYLRLHVICQLRSKAA